MSKTISNREEVMDKYTEDSDTDMTIFEDVNPYRYIDITLQRCAACLNKDDMKSGFFQYIILINKLEAEIRAIGLLTQEYKEKIEAFKKTEEYQRKANFEYAREMKLANKKYEILFSILAQNKNDNAPLIVPSPNSRPFPVKKEKEEKEEDKSDKDDG